MSAIDINLAGRQKGAAFLAFLLIIVIGSAYMLLTRLSPTTIQIAMEQHDARVLAEAKQALIAYAISYGEKKNSAGEYFNGKYGFMPCPDRGSSLHEGASNPVACGSRYENSLGRLPWLSLGIEPLKDSNGECLWYVVSGQHKYSSNAGPRMLNADSYGTFQVFSSDNSILSGATPEDRPIAAIIAPGAVLQHQDRSENSSEDVYNCGGNYNPANYLNAQNPSSPSVGITNYIVGESPDEVDRLIVGSKSVDHLNDRIVYITREDVFDAIWERDDFRHAFYRKEFEEGESANNDDDSDIDTLTKWLAMCIAEYGNASQNPSLPHAASVVLSDYRDDNGYTDVSGLLVGRLPLEFNESNSISGKFDFVESLYDCNLEELGFNVDEENQDKFIEMLRHWKDHYFYAVSDLFQPRDSDFWGLDLDVIPEGQTPSCFICQEFALSEELEVDYCPSLCSPEDETNFHHITILDDSDNKLGHYSAVVIFANRTLRLDGYDQRRRAPPLDIDDDKGLAENYLDNQHNQLLFNDTDLGSDISIRHSAMSESYNDIMYCISYDDSTGHMVESCPF